MLERTETYAPDGQALGVKQVNVNWNINLGTIFTVIVTSATVLIYVNTLANKVDEIERFRQSRVASSDKNFSEIQSKLAQVPELTYRVGQTEGAITAMNDRMNRFADSFLGTAESIKKDVNSLVTKFEVMSQKIDTLGERRADFKLQTFPAETIR